ncbi:MAG: SCO family protein [Oligoflexia bacterium]|nr:SCO family protein [Oligoflexia bacterium]
MKYVFLGLFFSFQVVLAQDGIGIVEKTGSSIDLSLQFKDELGNLVQLKDYFNGHKPVLITLVYFGCPSLCTLVLNAAIDSLNNLSLVPGRDFEVLAISFDDKETQELALEKKTNYLKTYNKPDASGGFHFLTSTSASIQKLTTQMGFKFKWDKEQQQFAHASAIYILTSTGTISRALYGIMYPPQDVRLALIEASQAKIGTIVDKLLLFCYQYDATNKKYVLKAHRIMTLSGGVTLAVLGVFMAAFWLRV